MIQGHIDFVSRTRVEGWIHSERVSLAGTRVLAFIDQTPVGGGDIGLFRDDLFAAGIGDGRAGFRFPIELKPSHDPRLLDIRLEGSNAFIRQAHACLIARDDVGAETRRAPPSADTLAWMLDRGWLTLDQHAALGQLGKFGVYRERLTLPAASRGMPYVVEYLASLAGEFLELHFQRHVTARVDDDIWEENLASLRTQLHFTYPSNAPVIGLWTPSTHSLNVSEGSHLGARRFEIISGVDYEFGDEHLLWVNLDTNFHVPTGGFPSPAIAFVPAPT